MKSRDIIPSPRISQPRFRRYIGSGESYTRLTRSDLRVEPAGKSILLIFAGARLWLAPGSA